MLNNFCTQTAHLLVPFSFPRNFSKCTPTLLTLLQPFAPPTCFSPTLRPELGRAPSSPVRAEPGLGSGWLRAAAEAAAGAGSRPGTAQACSSVWDRKTLRGGTPRPQVTCPTPEGARPGRSLRLPPAGADAGGSGESWGTKVAGVGGGCSAFAPTPSGLSREREWGAGGRRAQLGARRAGPYGGGVLNAARRCIGQGQSQAPPLLPAHPGQAHLVLPGVCGPAGRPGGEEVGAVDRWALAG